MDIKLINQIISKIRNIYRYHPKYKNILKQKAIIDLSETDDGIILSSISFNDWDRITLSNTNVVYHPEYGDWEVLLEYTSWDEFLQL